MTRTLVILNRLDVVQATVRALQFREHLADATFKLRTPAWTTTLQRLWPQRRLLRWPADWVARLACQRSERSIVAAAKQSDVVYSVGVPSIGLHTALTMARKQSGFRLVTDLVDAQWLPWFAQFGWGDMDRMLAESDAVFATNEYLAEYARQHCGHVVLIPDAPQIEVFDEARRTMPTRKHDGGEVRIGWVGGRDTVFSLHRVHEALERVAEQRPQMHLRIVGAPEDRLPRFEKVRWSSREHYDQAGMVAEALQMHIGLFPQFHVSESLFRGALKSKIYMAAEAVAISERLGENEQLINDGANGMLAEQTDEWSEKLLQLIDDAALRQRLATAGLQTIRDQFTAEKIGSQLQTALEDVARQGSRS